MRTATAIRTTRFRWTSRRSARADSASSIPTVLLGSMGITLTNASGQGYFMEDGVVKNFLIDERYKRLVVFLAKCYKAGIDQSGSVHPRLYEVPVGRPRRRRYGEGRLHLGMGSVGPVRQQLAPQYVSMAPLKETADSEVQVSWDYDYDALNYGVNIVVMSAKTKNKEAAMRFINELYDPVVSMQVLFGSIGPNIEDNGDGSYAVLPPADPKMDPGTWKWTSTLGGQRRVLYRRYDLMLTLGTDMQEVCAQIGAAHARRSTQIDPGE